MANDEKVIEGEVVSEEEVKENGFKRFWKKTKQSVSDAVLENKIESNFNSNNTKFTLYKYDEVFSKSFFGSPNEDFVNAFGKIEATKGSIIINEKTNEAFKVVSVEESTCTAVVDAIEYERPATKITLSKNVTEVKVVKAGKRYFLYEE